MTVANTSTGKEQSAKAGGSADRLARPEGGALLGEAVVLIWNDVLTPGREIFYDWHDKEHIPERLNIPGFLRGRRYRKAGHSPEWLTIYEASGLDVLVSPEYLARLNAPTPRTVNALKYFQNTSRAVCTAVRSMGESSGGHVLAMRLDLAAAQSEAMCRLLSSEVFPSLEAQVGVVACHLFAADRPGSYLATAESSTREFDVPSWVLLIETTTAEAAESALQSIDAAKLPALGVKVRGDFGVYSLEICRLASLAATP
jgi:hypothetical protein